MEEERVVLLRTVDEPAHGVKHILARGNLARVACVVGEEHDVLGAVPAALDEEAAHVVHCDKGCWRGRDDDYRALIAWE